MLDKIGRILTTMAIVATIVLLLGFWAIDTFMRPDLMRGVGVTRENAVTLEEAQTAKTLAEAAKAEAEAQSIRSSGIVSTANGVMASIVAIVIMAGVVLVSGRAWRALRGSTKDETG